MTQNVRVPVTVHRIMAGKLRRYRHLSIAKQLTMARIVFPNIRDAFKVGIGFLQSVFLLARVRPDVVFAKGGYVCLPVGMAAKVLRIPLVIHDSDARPGLTNAILGRWASAIATGSPLENYHYRPEVSRYVGVPIGAEFRPYDERRQRETKVALGFDEHRPLIAITGGGLGAVSINTATLQDAPLLLAEGVQIFHITGRKNFDEVAMLADKDTSNHVVPFVFEGMADVLGAADVVVSRASATFIQELAGLAKPTVLIPAKTLTDQHKNAEAYQHADAAVVLTDDEITVPGSLYHAIHTLLNDASRRQVLASNLHAFARPHAARDVAKMIIETTRAHHN